MKTRFLDNVRIISGTGKIRRHRTITSIRLPARKNLKPKLRRRTGAGAKVCWLRHGYTGRHKLFTPAKFPGAGKQQSYSISQAQPWLADYATVYPGMTGNNGKLSDQTTAGA